jgi:glycosyltransferase involved in cell wall biosynthesis
VPGARLIAVGAGDDRARLEARAAAAKLDGAICFLGKVAGEDLAALYRASAFFVMPSTGEGFGLTYLEAMQAGRPCIAVHGAADEIIHDGVNGFLVQAGQSEALIDAVVRLFTDRKLRVRMGDAAAASVAQEFTAAHFARRFRTALGLSVLTTRDSEYVGDLWGPTP